MFHPAQGQDIRLRMALMGPSGSGKTFSSLLLAQGLTSQTQGKIALIDTERRSSELYAHLHSFDVANLHPPFTPESYIKAIKTAERAGYEVLIIDSLSHAWAGQGGVLEIQDRVAKSTRNSFTAWREVTPMHNALVDAMLDSPCHIIATMRTKTAYEVVTENGKTKVNKLGLSPIQREGFEYEFTLVLDLAIEGHVAHASKDRTGQFDGQYFAITADTGIQLRNWLVRMPATVQPNIPNMTMTKFEHPAENTFFHEQLYRIMDSLGLITQFGAYEEYVCDRYKVRTIGALNKEQLVEQTALLRQCQKNKDKFKQLVSILAQDKAA